jgi:hypothetical protein
MRNAIHTDTKAKKCRRYIGLSLILLWAGFWIFFAVASLLTEPFSRTALFNVISFSVILSTSIAIVWRWETIGGIVLVLESLFIFIAYPIRFNYMPLSTVLFVLVTMALPPLITGSLSLVNRYMSNTSRMSN